MKTIAYENKCKKIDCKYYLILMTDVPKSQVQIKIKIFLSLIRYGINKPYHNMYTFKYHCNRCNQNF